MSDSQKRAYKKYAASAEGQEARKRADAKRNQDPERKAYLAAKMREYRRARKNNGEGSQELA